MKSSNQKRYPLKPVELAFKRAFLACVRPFFEKPAPRTDVIELSKVRRVLLLRYDKLGDMVVSLPTVDTLHKFNPDLEIDILASKRNVSLIRKDPRFANVYVYTKNVFRDIATIQRIRKREHDVVMALISLSSVTSLVVAQWAGKGITRIGLGQDHHKEYYHYYLPVDLSLGEHMVDVTLRSLGPFGIERKDCVTDSPLYITDDVKKRADEIWNALGLAQTNDSQVIGVNISAGRANRLWSESNFSDLLTRLKERFKERQFIVLCAPEDRDRAIRICRDAKGAAMLVPGGLSILQVSALVSRLAVLITPDTSMTHVARSFDVPVVGLYSKHRRNTNEWRPYGQSYGIVQGSAEDDIFDISVTQVMDEFERVISIVYDGTSTQERVTVTTSKR